MGVYEILTERGFIKQCTAPEDLAERLEKEPITFYAGFDPTGDSLHIGHLVPIQMMAWLQRAGHHGIAVMGDGTAMVGDPSGKSEMRQMLTPEYIQSNSERFKEQLAHFLDLDGDQGRMVYNGEWLLPLNYIGFLRDIGRMFSVNRMLSFEAYKQRLERGLSFIEFNYQLLQAYDFLELYRRHGCTLQVGGDDQWGNIVAGMDLIRRVEQGETYGLTVPLITTASGAKMGKTASGAVWLDGLKTSPFDYYQYWLNVDDLDVGRFLKLYTFLPMDEIATLEALEGADIRQAKRVLAKEATALVHGEESALQAETGAKAMAAGAISEDLPTFCVPSTALEGEGTKLVVLLSGEFSGALKSRGEARRLIAGGGVRINGEKVLDTDHGISGDTFDSGDLVVRLGKKRAIRLTRE